MPVRINKNSIFYHCLLLSTSSVVLQLLGFGYRILLGRLAGAQAIAVYNLVMSAYNVVLSCTLTGVALSVSRIASGYQAVGEGRSIVRLIRTALIRYEGRQLNEDYCCYYDAPVLVIASNEPTRTGGMDCACALQNMFLAAHSLGIASCWINQLSYTCDAPEVRAYLKRLGVPTVHKVYGCAALGYNGGKEPAAHPRKEGLVSYAE